MSYYCGNEGDWYAQRPRIRIITGATGPTGATGAAGQPGARGATGSYGAFSFFDAGDLAGESPGLYLARPNTTRPSGNRDIVYCQDGIRLNPGVYKFTLQTDIENGGKKAAASFCLKCGEDTVPYSEIVREGGGRSEGRIIVVAELRKQETIRLQYDCCGGSVRYRNTILIIEKID